MKGKPGIQHEWRDPRGPLFACLAHEIAGFTLHASDVVVSTVGAERRADWAGTDAHGRLVLVILGEPNDETLPAHVLAALAWAGDGRATAAQRWIDARLRVDLEPRVLVVAGSYSTRALRALDYVSRQVLVLLELSTLDSTSGRVPFLVPARREGVAANGTTSVSFATWPAAVRDVLSDLARDVKRVDPEIESIEHAGVMRWVWRGDEVGRVTTREGRLVASDERSRVPAELDDDTRRSAWLERFLLQHCARRLAGTAVAKPFAVLDRSAGPLLSAEEIAAFRD